MKILTCTIHRMYLLNRPKPPEELGNRNQESSEVCNRYMALEWKREASHPMAEEGSLRDLLTRH